MDTLRLSPRKQGYLIKGDPNLKKWQKRFFILQGSRLAYYKEGEKYLKNKPRGILHLAELESLELITSDFPKKKMKKGISIKLKEREYQMFSESEGEIDEWFEVIQRAKDFFYNREYIENVRKIKYDPDLDKDEFLGYYVNIKAEKLAPRDSDGLNDPFIEVRLAAENTVLLYKSEVTPKTLDPYFDPFVIPADRICKAMGAPLSEDAAKLVPLLFKFYDFDNDGKHDLIGEFESTCEGILEKKSEVGTTIVNKEWRKMRETHKGVVKFKSCGEIYVLDCKKVYKEGKPPKESVINDAVPIDVADEPQAAAQAEPQEKKKDKKKKKKDIEGYIISLSCANLMKMDILGKADPVLTVDAVPKGSMKGNQPVNVCFYWSETHKKTYDADFKSFTLPADLFDEKSVITFQIHDWDKDGLNFIGKVSVTVGEMLVSSGHRYALMKDKESALSVQLRDPGFLILNYCVGEPKAENCPNYLASDIKTLELVVECRNLDRKDITGSSDPFLEIIGQERDKDFKVRKRYGIAGILDPEPSVVYRSGVIKKNKNPTFPAFRIDVDSVGGLDGLIKLQVTDADNSGGHDFIGHIENMTLRSIITQKPLIPWKNPDKESRGKLYRNSGFFQLKEFKAFTEPLPKATGYEIRAEVKNIRFQLGDRPDPFLEIVGRPLVPPRPLTPWEMEKAGDPAAFYDVKNAPKFLTRTRDMKVIHRTERYKDQRNVNFNPFILDAYSCGGMDSDLTITLYDQEKSGEVEVVGECHTTLRQMVYYHDDQLWTRLNTPQAIFDANPKRKKELRYTALFNVQGRPLDQVEELPPFEGPGGVVVTFCGRNLPNLDAAKSRLLGKLTGDKSDPFLIIQEHSTGRLIYKTEVIHDNLNPDFQQGFLTCIAGIGLGRYSKGIDDMSVDISIMDFDKDGTHDVIHTLKNVSYRELLVANASWILPTVDSKLVTALTKRPMLEVTSASVVEYRDAPQEPYAIRLKIGADNLDRKDVIQSISLKRIMHRKKKEKKNAENVGATDSKDLMGTGKSDPFLLILNLRGQLIHKSEIVFNSLEAQWQEFEVRVDGSWASRCLMDEPIRVLVMDYDRDGDADLIGEFMSTLREMTMPRQIFPLINPRKEKYLKLAYRNSGMLRVMEAQFLLPELNLAPPPVPKAFTITFSATNLDSKEVGKGSRAYFILYAFPRKKLPQDPWKKYQGIVYESAPIPTPIYRSEIVEEASPTWNPFLLTLDQAGGSLDCTLCVEVFHAKENGSVTVIGGCSMILIELTCPFPRFPIICKRKEERKGKQMLRLYPYRNSGELHCVGCENLPMFADLDTSTQSNSFDIRIVGRGMDNKDIIGKSDPFFTISGIPDPVSLAPYIGHHQLKRVPAILHRSEVLMNDLNPDWNPFSLDVESCGGLDYPLIITVYDWEKNGGHEVIGSCIASMRQLMMAEMSPEIKFPIFPVKQRLTKKIKRKQYSGYIHIESCHPNDGFIVPPAVTFTAKVGGLDRKDLFGLKKSDPFISFYVEYPLSAEHSALDESSNIPIAPMEGTLLPAKAVVTEEAAEADRKAEEKKEEEGLTKVEEKLQKAEEKGPPSNYTMWYKLLHTGGYWRQFAPYESEDYSSELLQNESMIQIYCSERYKSESSPEFEAFTLEKDPFVSLDSTVFVGLFDYDMDGTHDLIAMAKTTFRELVYSPAFGMPLVNEERKRKKPFYRNSGVLTINCEPEWTAPQKPMGFEFTVEGHKFDRKDTFSSDPYLEIFGTPVTSGKPSHVVVFRSEVHRKNLSPKFEPFSLTLSQTTSLDTPIDLVVKDWDKDGTHDLIGNLRTTLRMMGTSKLPSWKIFNPEKKRLKILRTPNSGHLKLNPKPIFDANHLSLQTPPALYTVTCKASKLDKKDMVKRNSDPYICLYSTPLFYQATEEDIDSERERELKGLVEVYRSEILLKNLNPEFQPFQVPTISCTGIDSPVRFALFDYDKEGTPDLIGITEEISLRILSLREVRIPIVNPHKRGRPGYRNSGVLTVSATAEEDFSVFMLPTMIEMTVSVSKLQRMDVFGKGDPTLVVERGRAVLPERVFRKPKAARGRHVLKDPFLGDDIEFAKTRVYRSEVHKKTDTCTFEPFSLSMEDCGGPYNDLTFWVMDWDNDGTLSTCSWFKANYFLMATQSGRNLMAQKIALPTKRLKRNAGYINFDKIEPQEAKTLESLPKAYKFKFSAKNLDRKDIFSKTDPYLVVKGGPYDNQEDVVLYKSEVYKTTHNPSFLPFTLDLGACGGFFKDLSFEVYDFDVKSNHDFVGRCTLSLKEIITAKIDAVEGTNAFPLVNRAKKMRKPGYRNSGILYLEEVSEVTEVRHATEVRFSLLCKHLDRKDLMSANDPYVEILGHPFVDHRSEMNRKQKSAFRAGMVTFNPVHGWKQEATPTRSIPMRSYLNPEKLNETHIVVGNSLLPRPAAQLDTPLCPVYRTSVLNNTSDPYWSEVVLTPSDTGGMDRELIVNVMDYDSNGKHAFIGSTRTTLRQLGSKRGEGETLNEMVLINHKKKSNPLFMLYRNSGFLCSTNVNLDYDKMRTDDVMKSYRVVFSAQYLDSMDSGSKSDPYFEIRRLSKNPNKPIFDTPEEKVKWKEEHKKLIAEGVVDNLKAPPAKKEVMKLEKIVYKSEIFQDASNCVWSPADISISKAGGFDSPLTFTVYDSDGADRQVIGAFETTARQLSFVGFKNVLHRPGRLNILKFNCGTITAKSCEKIYDKEK